MDNELFIKLLEQNNRVVIPGFGAFLKKNQGESNVIAFTPFLKKDDGLLRNALAEQFQVDDEEASAIIEGYVDAVQTKLAESGRYYIEELGTLKLDANGSLTFLYDLKPKTATVVKPQVAEDEANNQVAAPQQESFAAPQTPSLVANQSPMQAMVTDEPQAPISRPIQAESQPLQPRPIQQSPLTRPVNQGRAPIPQPAQRVATPQPRPISDVQNQQRTQQPRPAGQRPMGAQQRPVVKSKSPAKLIDAIKSDIWLMIAIGAALLVIALMIYSFANDSKPEFIDTPPAIENTVTQPTE